MAGRRDLTAFWDLAETNFPLAGPRAHLAEQLGDLVPALESAGLLSFLRVADRFPCPRPGGAGCPRHLIELADGTYQAVCGDDPPECEELQLAPGDVDVLGISPERLCEALRAPLLFGGRVEQLQGLRHVYHAGVFIPAPGIRHSIYVAVRCSGTDYAEVFDALRSRHDGGAFAVLVPTDRFISTETRRQMETLGIPLIELATLIHIGADGRLSTAVEALDLFSAIGRRGPSTAGRGSQVHATVRTQRGREDLDEAGYKRLLEAAGDYEIFADERSRTVTKRTAGGEKPEHKSDVQAGYFQMIHAAVEKTGYFDPAIDAPDEDMVSGKQIFQRARKAIDVKYRAPSGTMTWRLLKSAKVENRTVYRFQPDPDCKFALIFLPRS